MQTGLSNITFTGPKTPRDKAMEKKQDNDQNIQVFVRCRPLDSSRQPPERRAPLEVDRIRRQVKVSDKTGDKGNKCFYFDDVFDASIGQCEVYDGVVKPLVHEVLSGYNCTVFAYGQTGTGKTYTMEGGRSDFECSWQDDPKAGIVPRALDQIFEALNERTNTQHTISVSYLELYNENLFDLLSPCSDLMKLNIYEDNTQKGKVKVGNLAEVAVTKKDEIFEILKKGSAKRQTAATKLNACSSRSHTIFCVTVRTKDIADMDGEEIYRMGKLNLVDLAGSENIGRSGAVEKRATEAGQINRSLLTLGRVITCLVDKQSHIPYRESKLTRLLQDSLGGRTKTSIIATISPSTLDLEDTLSTLEYAQRAKKITNKPELNQKLTKDAVLKDLTAEIERLRRDLYASQGCGNAISIDRDNYNQMSDRIDRQSQDLEQKEKQLAGLEADLERTKILFGETSAHLENRTQQLTEARTELHSMKEKLNQAKAQLQAITQELDEQKHLVEAHVHTEQVLSTQARVLLDVANTTTNHVDQLHQKVERVKKIEETNSQTASSFLNSFQNGMQNMINSVNKLEYIHGCLNDLQQIVEPKLTAIHSQQSSLQENISLMSSSVTEKLAENITKNQEDTLPQNLQQLSDTIVKTGSGHSNMCTSLTDRINSARSESALNFQAGNRLAMDQRTSLETKIMEISGSLTDGKQMNTERRKKLATEIDHIFSTLIDEIDSLKAQLNQSVESLKQSQSNAAAAGQKFGDELTSCRKENLALTSSFVSLKRDFMSVGDQLNKLEERLAQANQSHSQLASQHESLLQEQLRSGASSIDLIDSTTGNCSALAQTCKNSSTEVKMIVDSASAENEKLIDTAISAVNSLDETYSKHFQEAMEQKNQTESSLATTFESLVTVVDEHKENMKTKFDECVGQTCELAKTAADAALERSNNMAALTSDISAKADQLKLEVVEQINNLEEIQQTTANEFHLIKLSTKLTQKDLLKELNDRSSEVKSLVQAGLKKDSPTGRTPMKTSFNYPKHLAATSPHPRILDRYRQTLENMKPE